MQVGEGIGLEIDPHGVAAVSETPAEDERGGADAGGTTPPGVLNNSKLTSEEALWLRVECCLQILRVCLPHETCVAASKLLATDRSRWVGCILVRSRTCFYSKGNIPYDL